MGCVPSKKTEQSSNNKVHPENSNSANRYNSGGDDAIVNENNTNNNGQLPHSNSTMSDRGDIKNAGITPREQQQQQQQSQQGGRESAYLMLNTSGQPRNQPPGIALNGDCLFEPHSAKERTQLNIRSLEDVIAALRCSVEVIMERSKSSTASNSLPSDFVQALTDLCSACDIQITMSRSQSFQHTTTMTSPSAGTGGGPPKVRPKLSPLVITEVTTSSTVEGGNEVLASPREHQQPSAPMDVRNTPPQTPRSREAARKSLGGGGSEETSSPRLKAKRSPGQTPLQSPARIMHQELEKDDDVKSYGSTDSKRSQGSAVLGEVYRMSMSGRGNHTGPSFMNSRLAVPGMGSPIMMFQNTAANQPRGGGIEDVFKCSAEIVFGGVQPLQLLSYNICKKAMFLTNALRSTLYFYDQPSKKLTAFIPLKGNFTSDIEVVNGRAKKCREVVAARDSIESRCALTSKTQSVYLADMGASDIFDDAMESIICLPIRGHDGGLLGVLKVIGCRDDDDREIDFTKDDEAALGSFGVFCGATISVSKMHNQLEKTAHRMKTMLTIARTLSGSALSTDDLSRNIIGAAKDLLHADRCALFLVQYNNELAKDELVASVTGPDGTQQKISVPMGVGIAGHVGQTGEALNIADAYQDPRFNPTADKQTGYKTTSLLCVPVRYGDKIVAVAQLVNKSMIDPYTHDKRTVSFSDEDVSVFNDFAVFAGVNLYNAMLHEKMMHEKRKQNAILEVIQQLKDADVTRTHMITECVMTSAKQLGNADRCALFLVDKETNELYTTVADNSAKEIRIPKAAGVAGWVAMNGKPLNIKEAYEDPRFNTAVDKATGYRTQTILCMPVFHMGEVIAVTQLVNKRGGHFTHEDEDVLTVFTEFAAMTLRTAQMFEFMRRSEVEAFRLMNVDSLIHRKSSAQAVNIDAATIEQCKAVRNSLPANVKTSMWTTSFPIHDYHPTNNTNYPQLIPILVEMFHQMDFLRTFNIPEDTLYRFLIAASRKYRVVPYHNFTHAFDVTQTLMVYLKQGNLVPKYLRPVDAFVLVVCGICHDMDHMGVNNSFHFKAETPLAVLSSSTGSRSVLEVHHCNLAIDLLSQDDLNLFCGLTNDDEVKDVWKTLINAILATDMARHGEVCEDWRTMMTSGGYDNTRREHSRLMVAFLLKCADISNISKPFDISKVWGQYVTAEFTWQGATAAQKSMAASVILPQQAALDVESTFHLQKPLDLAKGQVGFMEGVGVAMYTKLAEHVPELSFVAEQLLKNLAVWKQQITTLSNQ